LLLGAAALFAHGVLLLNDGIYWDDWLLLPQLHRGDWQSIDALVREAGLTPFNAAFLDSFAYLPGGVFTVKLAAFALIVAIACLAYLIAIEAGLGRLDAWLVSALAMTFPGFQDWVLLATVAEVSDLAVFLLATFLLLRAERAEPVPRRALRLGAAVAFVLSFGLSSLLTLYFGALFLLLLVLLRSISVRDLLQTRWLYGLALLALPVLYWEVSQRFFQPSGLYVGYNAIATNTSVVMAGYISFIRHGISDQFEQALGVGLRPLVWPLFGALIVGLALAWRRVGEHAKMSRRPALAGAVLGFLALGLAILPYAAVGKYPTAHGWDTRHDLLVALPLMLLVVVGVRLALPSGRRALVGIGLLGIVAVALSATGIEDYAALQSRWATDQAVMAQLHKNAGAGRYSVYWVHDEAPGPEDFYRFYEWSAMLGNVYGGQTRIGLDTRNYTPEFLAHTEFFNDRYDLAGFDPRGCQADITVAPGPGAAGSDQNAVMYTFYRLIQPGQLASYLDRLVTVRVVPRPSPYATDCTQ
jgi:hypothetical protein